MGCVLLLSCMRRASFNASIPADVATPASELGAGDGGGVAGSGPAASVPAVGTGAAAAPGSVACGSPCASAVSTHVLKKLVLQSAERATQATTASYFRGPANFKTVELLCSRSSTVRPRFAGAFAFKFPRAFDTSRRSDEGHQMRHTVEAALF